MSSNEEFGKKSIRRTKESFEPKSGSGSQGAKSKVSRTKEAPKSGSGKRSANPKATANKGAKRSSAAAAGTVKAASSAGQAKKSAGQRRRREDEMKKRRLRQRLGCLAEILVVVVCIILGATFMKSHFGSGKKKGVEVSKEQTDQKNVSNKDDKKDSEDKAPEATTEAKAPEKSIEEIHNEAKLLAAGYDYDAAIELIKTIPGYESDEKLTESINKWEETKKNLVKFGASDVTHIFYHTLVVDPKLAFECEPSIANNFKQWMTTVLEFNNITQTMYDEGYVLVSLYDFFDETYDADGNPHFTEKYVYLPKGKKPFVLSLDDLSYYHSYTGHGMATKLIIGDNGKITCEYTEKDGSTSVGSYDCVPLLNDFMEEHPDGSYRGARGTIALTGYNGIFGYRTDMSYVTKKDIDDDKVDWLKAHPDFDHDKEVAEAKKIADELKAEGWDFASHTWGHIRIGNSDMDRIKRDTEKWLKNVKPIIGDTECIIFAHGQDLSSTDSYDTKNNKKYKYLSSKGFHIYLNVDSHQKTMAVHDEYVHGGRRNLDGYRLWSDGHGVTDWTSDLFRASEMLDPCRKDVPTPSE